MYPYVEDILILSILIARFHCISRPALIKLQSTWPLRHASRSRMRPAAHFTRTLFSKRARPMSGLLSLGLSWHGLLPAPAPDPDLTLARDGMLQDASAWDVGVVSRGKHMAEANRNDRHIRINCAGTRTRTDHGFISSLGAKSPRTPWNPGNSYSNC
jgi:hypothetical protein